MDELQIIQRLAGLYPQRDSARRLLSELEEEISSLESQLRSERRRLLVESLDGILGPLNVGYSLDDEAHTVSLFALPGGDVEIERIRQLLPQYPSLENVPVLTLYSALGQPLPYSPDLPA